MRKFMDDVKEYSIYDDHDRGYIADAEDRVYLLDDAPTEEIDLTEAMRI